MCKNTHLLTLTLLTFKLIRLSIVRIDKLNGVEYNHFQ